MRPGPARTWQAEILTCAYASRGDTKHVVLFPEDPGERIEFGALAFDFADRLRTPTFVLLDLDIGMNERLCQPLASSSPRSWVCSLIAM